MMKYIGYLLILITTAASAQGRATRVVVIGLDGFSSEGFGVAKHPNLDKLFENGAWSLTTRPVMPSVTMPNWTSHLTGSGPEEHGVNDNKWTLNAYPLPAVAKDEEGYYPSIFNVLKGQVKGFRSAYYYNWRELIYPINQKYIDEVSFEENDGYASNYNKAFNFLKFHRKEPSLVFLYSVHTDHAGHEYGWMTPQYIAALEIADKAIGELVDRLKAEGLFEDTHFMLITDHGGLKKGHGGVSLNEMQIPWAVTGPKIRKTGLFQQPNSNMNTSLVIAKLFGVRNLPEAWTGSLLEFLFR